jgi:hypothetical protein
MSLMRRGVHGGEIVDKAAPSLAISKKGEIWEAAADLGGVEEYISRQLKMDVIMNSQASLVEAMKTPEKWLERRNDDMALIKRRVAKTYADQVGKYYTAGYPIEEAQRLAEDAANVMLQIELRDLDVTHPGSSTIYASAANDMINRNNEFLIRNGGAESDKAVYKRYKKAKKQKKASKKQAQSGQ